MLFIITGCERFHTTCYICECVHWWRLIYILKIICGKCLLTLMLLFGYSEYIFLQRDIPVIMICICRIFQSSGQFKLMLYKLYTKRFFSGKYLPKLPYFISTTIFFRCCKYKKEKELTYLIHMETILCVFWNFHTIPCIHTLFIWV